MPSSRSSSSLWCSAVLYAGSQQRRLPAPFGPAANGVIPYVSNGDLYVGDPITGDSRLLVGGPEDDALPQFSPDGTRVAFKRDVGTTSIRPIDIYVVGADGSDAKPITPEPVWDSKSISWTPDGQSIAVVSQLDAGADKLDLYDAGGDGSVEMIASAGRMDSVAFRPPDGSEILFRGIVEGQLGFFAMDADGSNVHPLLLSKDPASDDFWGGAVYSADGSRIFYTRPYEHETATGTCCSLWVMNADGSEPHEFIPNDGAWEGQPVVSPDGSKVAFWHVGDTAQVSVANADGTGPVIRTGPELPDTARWVWAPDSSKILMMPNDWIEPDCLPAGSRTAAHGRQSRGSRTSTSTGSGWPKTDRLAARRPALIDAPAASARARRAPAGGAGAAR